jgi:Zn finger protein HypA/HybF involved in hydrogenase expression
MSSAFIIRCVLCKSQFEQVESRTRFCQHCRSSKMRSTREVYYKKRKEMKRGFNI